MAGQGHVPMISSLQPTADTWACAPVWVVLPVVVPGTYEESGRADTNPSK